MRVLISAKNLWMVRSALACPLTVVSIILLKVMHFLGYSSNCVRVLEDGVSEVFETASVSSGGSLEHGPEFCGAYLCDYLLGFNKVGSVPTLSIGDGIFG